MKLRPLAAILGRLVWLSLLPLLLVASGVAIFHVLSEHASIRDNAERRLGNFAAQIDDFLEARIKALEILARSPLADDPRRWPELYAEAQAFQASFGSHVIFADAGRQMLFNTRVPLGTALPKLPDAHKGRSAAPIALATARPAVGDMVHGPVVNQPLVAIVVPGLRDGKVRHLMLVTTTIGELQQRIEKIPLQTGWAISVRDGAGELVARQAPAGFDPIRDVDAGWRFEARSRFAPWTFTIEVPRAVVQMPLRDSLVVLLTLVVLATLSGWALGRRVARRVMRQVDALAEVGLPAPVSDIVEIDAVRTRLDANFAALRESEARFEATFEQAAVGIALVAPDGRWLRANDTLCRIVGYAREELLARTFQDITHPDDLDADLDHVRRMLDSEIHTYTREKRYIRKDGEIIWINLTVSLVKKPDSTPDYFISVVEDISARKAAERALAESQAAALAEQHQARLAALNLMDDAIAARLQAERFRLLAESSSDFIGMCDLDMNPLYVNPAGRRMVGLPDMAAACRVKVQDYYFPEDQGFIAEEFFPRVLRDGHGDVEIRLRHFQTGEPIWMFYYLFSVRDASGTPVGWATVSRDITERRRAEAKLMEQIDELRRWQQAMLGREDRIIAVKQEVNELLAQLGQPPRYASARGEGSEK